MQATEAIERLREALGAMTSYSGPSMFDIKNARAVLAATATIDPAPVGAQDGGWISVDERLPEVDEDGIAWVRAVNIGAGDFKRGPVASDSRYVPSLGWQPAGCMGWDWVVTHWMPYAPLPASQSSTAGAAKGGNTNPEIPAEQPAANHALICPTCNVDRLKDSCPSLQSCGMTGTTYSAADHACPRDTPYGPAVCGECIAAIPGEAK